jgi:hypothetical protein
MSNYTYNYDETSSVLTVTKNIDDQSIVEKLYIKPSYDFGVLDTKRNHTPESDYLDCLRNEWISVVIGSRNVTLDLENGASYSKGVPLKLNNEEAPVPMNSGESIDIEVVLSNDRSFRINFEVM